MEKDLVSVIIPAYNHENYVQDTVESIIAQTYKNIELIVLDDGSKDSTWQKIQELKDKCEEQFVRVHFETKENEGTCKTLNKLISLTQGEFVYLIASDDMAKPEAIEKEMNFLLHNPDYVLAVGDNEFIDADNNRIGWGHKSNTMPLDKAVFKTFAQNLKKRHNYFNDNIFGNYSTLLKGNYITNGYLIRKTALKNIVFSPEAPLEDLFLMLQLSKLGKFKFIDEILFSYRWHGANTAARSEHLKIMCIKTYLYEKKLLEQSNNQELLEIFNRQTENYKTKFQIGNFIKYYRHNTVEYKENILKIFNKQIRIKYKNFLEN